MNAKQVQQAKKSVAKVMGVHRAFNYKEPYNQHEDVQFGGTAFFVNPKIFGKQFPIDIGDKRFALTNFHVVDELVENQCFLCYPDKGNSQILATVVFTVPSLDVAILMVDPHGEHPLWFDSGDIRDFIQTIPNLKVDEAPIKGNSQNVVAIGFPNLSTDYQLCEGCISGRGLGMLQLSISLNGGNSGGPLMMKGKVIGINTASITDSEALGLAVPIHQILRFLRHWTSYDNIILRTPSWGIATKTTTSDYLEYFGIDSSIQGCTINKSLKNGAISQSNIREKDIIVGIASGNKRYNVDNFGLVSVSWTDKRVPIENQEFILSLNPDDITLDVFQWKTKKIKQILNVVPFPIDFKVRDMHHCWEDVPYCILGGMVFMNLSIAHLEVEDEDEEAYCSPDQAIPLVDFCHRTMHSKTAVVITHIPAQTHIAAQGVLRPFDRILKCNNKTVKDVLHLQSLLKDCVQKYKASDAVQKDSFVVLETNKSKVYLQLERLHMREVHDVARDQYPGDKCMLLNIKKRKRKYSNMS